MTTERMNIEDVKHEKSWYPREKWLSGTVKKYADSLYAGDVFPAIILDRETGNLLDGMHRLMAQRKLVSDPTFLDLDDAGDIDVSRFETIEVEYHDIPEGVHPRLYAHSLSSRHGVRPKTGENKETAIVQYGHNPGMTMVELGKFLGVSHTSARTYVKHLIAEFEDTINTVVVRLTLLGWTQGEIAETLQRYYPNAKGTSQQSIANFLPEMKELSFLVKSEVNKGHPISTVAKKHGLPELLTHALVMDGMSDDQRMEQLKIKVQPYDVWNFAKCDDLFGDKHPGRIPGQLIAHALYFFTEQGDTVIDPMTGSGTTQDVCLAMGRKCYGYDIDDRHGRHDVIPNDIAADGWPDRIKKADLIFWDPPYFEKMDKTTIGGDGYIDGSISGFVRSDYLDFFAQQLASARASVKKGCKIAFLMSDWDDNTGERDGVFIWDYAKILQDAGWTLTRHIQAPLSTQLVHPDIVNKFRASKRLARLERYLLIAEAG